MIDDRFKRPSNGVDLAQYALSIDNAFKAAEQGRVQAEFLREQAERLRQAKRSDLDAALLSLAEAQQIATGPPGPPGPPGIDGAGEPPQAMTQLVGATIDEVWRDWSPAGITLKHHAVYQVLLKIADDTDVIFATGQFVWSTASPQQACSSEVPLHQISGSKQIYVKVISTGDAPYKLQIASSAALAAPIVDAKFKLLIE